MASPISIFTLDLHDYTNGVDAKLERFTLIQAIWVKLLINRLVTIDG